MDRKKIIAELVERLDVKIDEDDPAFVLVELNALVFQELIEPLLDRLDGLAKLPSSLDEKARTLDDQIGRLNASKEMLIAEIAMTAKRKVTEEIKGELNSVQEQTKTLVGKMLTKQTILLAILFICLQVALKFL